jgi:DNA-binding MarR family transcriptional regulator
MKLNAAAKKDARSTVLARVVVRFMRALHRYDFGRTLPVLHAARLTTAQLAVLEFAREPQTVSAVATYLGLSRPATSQLIDRLVRARLVRRIESTSDRRKRNVILSAKGETLVDRVAAARAARFASALAILPAPVAARFELVLREVIDVFDRTAPMAPGRSSRIPPGAATSARP